MLSDKDMNIVEETLYAIKELTSYHEIATIDSLTTIFDPLMKYIYCETLTIQETSIITIGNLVNLNDSITISFIHLGLVKVLSKAISNTKFIKEICWVLSNIACSGQIAIKEMIQENIYDKMIVLTNNKDFRIIKEAIWVLLNSIISANAKQIEELSSKEIIERIIEILKLKDIDLQFIILDGLMKIIKKMKSDKMFDVLQNIIERLEKNSYADIIEEFCMHRNEKLSNLATQILKSTNMDVEFVVREHH